MTSMNDVGKQPSQRRWLSMLGNTIVCLAILAASAAAIMVINRTEPTAQQINAKRKSAALVETVMVQRGTYAPQLVVLGTVQPAQEVMLSPRVRGHVMELSPSFAPGGMVSQGDILLQIDPADFENALSIRESELKRAKASLDIEKGRQTLAKKELELLGDSIDDTNRALVLREPQFTSIKSEVSAAEAAVQRAKLDLERCTVVAPFDAQILSRSVNVGSQVAPGDELGQLVGIEEYWIMAAVPVRSLRWIQFPEAEQPGSAVALLNSDAWDPETKRQARVKRMIGALDEQSRLARVLVTVSDPLGQESAAPPLILDTLIEAQIEGKPIENVVRLRREYVHDRDTVWIMKDAQLEIRETTIEFRDAQYAYIREGLEGGDEVVTTNLATVANGVGLRKVNDVTTTTSEIAREEETD
jgi:RND family efflux transporter MFP subunit